MKYRTALECLICGNTTGPWDTAIQPIERHGEITLFGRDETIYMLCQCGGYFQNPIPTNASVDELYKNKYYSVFQARKKALAFEMPRALRMAEYLPEVSGDIIDVGCATGELMLVAKKAGWQVTGVEPSKAGREIAKRHGPVYCDMDEVDKTFDVVTSIHVLEHVVSPVAFLRDLARLAKPDGLIILAVPKDNYRPPHLIAVGEKQVEIMFNRAGLSDIEIETINPYGDLIDIIVKAGT